jgi:hypothetical protein
VAPTGGDQRVAISITVWRPCSRFAASFCCEETGAQAAARFPPSTGGGIACDADAAMMRVQAAETSGEPQCMRCMERCMARFDAMHCLGACNAMCRAPGTIPTVVYRWWQIRQYWGCLSQRRMARGQL